MDSKMFCFQCQQTAGCVGCMGNAGVCGKRADTAELQDKLTGALIALARAAEGVDTAGEADEVMLAGLFTTITNVNFDNDSISRLIDRVHAEHDRLSPNCANCANHCMRYADYDMRLIWDADEDVRSLKSLILFGLRGMAAYAYHAMLLGERDAEVNECFFECLRRISETDDMQTLLPLVLRVGEVNLKCMEMLDRANTTAFGTPAPATVPLKVEKGPFIVVTGHDLYDLKLLLEQTEGKGVNVYTHGEMLPAHGYPELRKFKHLKGNFGTAWQNQRACAVYHKLPYAGTPQLCRPRVHDRGCGLSGN